jgi:predicted TIM-barrel fold metal-dependent hydrolase
MEMKIEILGDGCSRCDKFYKNVLKAVKESGKEIMLMLLLRLVLISFVSLSLYSVATVGAVERELYLIDAHSQVDQTVDLNKVISLMDQAGIQYTILSAVAERSSGDIVRFSRQHPGRIIAAVRMKMRAYNENDKKYYEALKREVESDNFNAMSEGMMYHAQKGHRYSEIVVYPDDERVQTALRYALEKGWPFVVHIEFASRSIRGRGKFMEQLEAMLVKYPTHPFAMAHMGQLNASEVRRLIKSHPNVYFLTSRSNPVAANEANQPWVNMFKGDVLAPEWRELAIQYPDRFVISFDNVVPQNWGDFYLRQVQYWRKALSALPPDVAHAIAHGNAERLWKIPPK